MPHYTHDYEEINRNTPILDVAARLNLQLKQLNATQWRCPCPSGRADERGLLVTITPGKQVWYSHAAKVGGSVLQLVMFVQNLDPKNTDHRAKAASWIKGGIASEPEKSASGPRPTGGLKPVELVHDHPLVEVNGLMASDAARFGIGYREESTTGKPRAGEGNVLIPVYADGVLAGYLGVQEITWLPKEWRA